MGKTGSCFRIGAAVLLAVAFCLTLAPSLLLGDIRAVLFDSQRMSSILTDTFVRSGAVSTYAAGLFSGEVGSQTQITSYLTQAQWSDLVHTLFPAAWQEDQVAANLNQGYGWLDSSDPLPGFSFSLTLLKQELQGGGATHLAEVLVSSWPPCSAQQLLAYASGAFGQGSLPVCRPPDPLRSDVQQGVTQEIDHLANQLPDSLDLGQASAASGSTETLKTDLRLLRDFAPVAWLLPLLLLLLELALAARSVPGLLTWTGVPLAAAALIGVGLALLTSAWRGHGLIPEAALPAALQTATVSLLVTLARSVAGRLLTENAILLFFGFILAVSSALVRPWIHPAPAVNPLQGRVPSPGLPPAGPQPPSQDSGPSATRGSTLLLPKDSPSDESGGRKKPPRGMFG